MAILLKNYLYGIRNEQPYRLHAPRCKINFWYILSDLTWISLLRLFASGRRAFFVATVLTCLNTHKTRTDFLRKSEVRKRLNWFSILVLMSIYDFVEDSSFSLKANHRYRNHTDTQINITYIYIFPLLLWTILVFGSFVRIKSLPK